MKELFKNIALGANAVLLVVLFWLSVSVNVDLGSKDPLAPVSRWLRGEAAPTQTVETSVAPAAYPVRIVAVQQEGIAVAFQQADAGLLRGAGGGPAAGGDGGAGLLGTLYDRAGLPAGF